MGISNIVDADCCELFRRLEEFSNVDNSRENSCCYIVDIESCDDVNIKKINSEV